MLREPDDALRPNPDPLERPDYHEADAQAIRAIWNGKATAEQQRRALDWMVWAFGTHDTSFRPGSARATDFAEGRRHAGTTLVWMIKSATTRTDPDKIATRNMEDE